MKELELSALSNNDTIAMAEKLRELNFRVIEKHNLSQKQMISVIRDFGEQLAENKVGLFYYSGHGTQVKGRNYLLPIGANIKHEDEVSYESIDVERVLAKMESSRNGVNILILDACRDNPFQRRTKGGSKGLARMDTPVGTFLAYATALGQVADDGNGDNGLFTSHLLQHLTTAGLDISEVLRLTRAGVLAESKQQGHQQVPWESSSLVKQFCFAGCKEKNHKQVTEATPPPPVKVENIAETASEAVRAVGAAAKAAAIAVVEAAAVREAKKLKIKPLLFERNNTQQDKSPFNGKWEGTATVGSRKFVYKWDLNQEESNITGEIFLSTLDGRSYGTYTINGLITGSNLYFEGIKFIDKSPNSTWCIASGNLSLTFPNNVPTMEGHWQGHKVTNGCPLGSRGSIFLEKR